MKLLSLVATLSCTSVMAVFSLGANAETLSNLSERSDSQSYDNITKNREATVQNDSANISQPSHIDPNHPQNSEKASDYDIFSLLQDRQITLDNLEQDIALEDVEWYIEKFEHIDL